MKKKIFFILQFLIFSIILSANNAETYNNFETFKVRMSTATLPFTVAVNASKGKEVYFAELKRWKLFGFYADTTCCYQLL